MCLAVLRTRASESLMLIRMKYLFRSDSSIVSQQANNATFFFHISDKIHDSDAVFFLNGFEREH